jgi:Putative addiction module component
LAARLLESLDTEVDEDAEEAWDAEIARRYE